MSCESGIHVVTLFICDYVVYGVWPQGIGVRYASMVTHVTRGGSPPEIVVNCTNPTFVRLLTIHWGTACFILVGVSDPTL